MEFLLPLLLIGFLIMVPIAFFLARRDTGKGPNPEDPRRQPE